jgi:ribosomal protein S8
MDPRQASTALRYAMQMCQDNNTQYIITLNESKYEEILQELEQHGFVNETNLIKKSIVRKLTDKSDKTKLLGIDVDMKYES